MSKRKLENIQCISLTVRENNILFKNIGHNCTTTATAVVELHRTYEPNHDVWFREYVGILCFIRDQNRKFFFLRLYNLESYEVLWEFRVPYWLVYVESVPFLHQFQGKDCIFGFNFFSEDEAKLFYKTVTTTLEKFAKIKKKQSKRYKGTLKRKNTLHKTEISGPSEFKHVFHYGLDKWRGLEMNLDCLQSTLRRGPKSNLKTPTTDQTWPDVIPYCHSNSSTENDQHVEYNAYNEVENFYNEPNEKPAQSNFLQEVQNATLKPKKPSSFRNRQLIDTRQADSTGPTGKESDQRVELNNHNDDDSSNQEPEGHLNNELDKMPPQSNFLQEIQNATLKRRKPPSFKDRQLPAAKQSYSTGNENNQMDSMRKALDKIKLANLGVGSDDDDYCVIENDSDWDD